jgi:hypothetical protein
MGLSPQACDGSDFHVFLKGDDVPQQLAIRAKFIMIRLVS